MIGPHAELTKVISAVIIPTYKELLDRIEELEGVNMCEDFKDIEEGLEKALHSYFERLRDKAKEEGEEWDDDRIDIIGQNGNDGLHYNEDKEGM